MSEIQNLELTVSMLPKLNELFFVMSPDFVDITRMLHYESKFNEIQHLKDQDFEMLGLETIRAMDLAADYAYIAKRFAKFAHVQYDKQSADLYFKEAGDALEVAGMKDSHSSREKWIDQNADFVKSKNLRDGWQAFVEWLDHKRDSFLQKHMWIKKQIDMRTAERGVS